MRIRPLVLTLLSTAALSSSGCQYFQHRDPPDASGRVEYIYDQRLPEALEDLFQTCEPTYHFSTQAGAIPVSLPHGNACAQQLSPAAAVLFPRLTDTLQGDRLRSSLIGSPMYDYGLWGHPNAYVSFHLEIVTHDFNLTPRLAEWVEPNPGEAALKVTFLISPASPLGSIVDINLTSPVCRTGCTTFTPTACNNFAAADCQVGLDAIPSSTPVQFGPTPLEVFFFFEPDPNGPRVVGSAKARFANETYFIWNAEAAAPNCWKSAMRGFVQRVHRFHWRDGAEVNMLDAFTNTIRPITYQIAELIGSPVLSNETVVAVVADSERNEMQLMCSGMPSGEYKDPGDAGEGGKGW